MNREDLEARLDEVTQNISIEEQRGTEKNETQIKIWMAEKREIEEKIAELDEQEVTAQAEQAHQERVQQATNELDGIFDNPEVGEGLKVRHYFKDESDYQIVSIAYKQAAAAKLAAFSEIISGYEEREIQMKRQNDILQKQLQESQQKIMQLNNENADLNNRLFNAGNELDKANAEIESLNAEIKAKSKPADASNAGKEMTPEERARKMLAKKAEITIYNVRPNRPINPNEYTATLAATGQDITYNWTQQNMYIVVDEETALQFRKEFEAANGIQSGAEDAQPAGEVESTETNHDAVGQFQTEEEVPPVLPDVQAPTPDREVASEAGTDVEARLSALEARVTALEVDNKILTANWPKNEVA